VPQDSTAGDTNDLPSVEAIDVKTVLRFFKKIVMLYVFLRFFDFLNVFIIKTLVQNYIKKLEIQILMIFGVVCKDN